MNIIEYKWREKVDIDPISGFVLLIAAILMIAILGYFGSAIIQSTGTPKVQKQIQETTETGIDTIVLITILSGAIGSIAVIALFAKMKGQ
jgi:hypothetical protein